jgi:hypothetical protein
MGSDDRFKKDRAERSKRKEKTREIYSGLWLFVCEGEKTELNYFDGLIKFLNNVPTNKKIKYKLDGTGRNTKSLVKKIELDDYFIEFEKSVRKEILKDIKTIVVFDKDSFTSEAFNTAIQMAEQKGYKVAWSNECFELWFLLHFSYYQCGNDRNCYFDNLKKVFIDQGIENGYEKKDPEIFNTLNKFGSINDAIRNAKKLVTLHDGMTSANSKPMTTVYKIIEELQKESGYTFEK